jgi:transcriptional regulator with XRE-family HTH domain
MDSYERKNRIREALSVRNMKQVELAEKSGIPKGTINNWLNQRYQPKQKSLMKLAKVLDVSEMWLAGYDVPMERPQAQIKNDELVQLIYEIKEDEDLKDLFTSICSLSGDQRNTIKSMVNELSKVNSLH